MRNRCCFALLIFFSCIFVLLPSASAESLDVNGSSERLISTPIGEPEIDIEVVIKNKVTKEIVEETYRSFSIEKPEKYTFDTSVYLIEYHVSTDYWNCVTSMDYKGLTEAIDYSRPTIYIPFFGDVADSEGTFHNRVLGHIKLSYDWMEKDYRIASSLYNLSHPDYKDKNSVGFYEAITDYLNQRKAVARQVFLIRYPSSLSDGQEKIAVIQTNVDTVILDVSNSLHLQTDEKESGVAPAYSISEYSARRKEVEKTLYQSVNGWENNPAGGIGLPRQKNMRMWIGIGIAVVAIAVPTTLLILRAKRRRAKNN